MATPSLSVDVPADAAYLKCIRGFITPILDRKFGEEDVRSLVLAVDEACSNIIKHGQSWIRPRGRISVEITDGKRRIEVKIHNFCGERDVDKIRPRDLDDIKPGGLGTHFIAEIMDSVEFVPDEEADGRMTLVMVKNTGGKQDNEADS